MRSQTDPIERFKASLSQAERAGITLVNAMSLATVNSEGRPSIRTMLLKRVDERGFVFYTNMNSGKGQELTERPFASLCFWWPPLEEQVRIDGRVERIPNAEADAYFATRPRGSQLAAWASKQSQVLPSRETLLAEVEKFRKLYKGKEVPRPPFWSGFLLVPDQIEFWLGRPDRLHERILYVRRKKSWKRTLLYP